jgi:hypothetical protein
MSNPFEMQLQELASLIGQAEDALNRAAALCPGDVAMQVGLLDRALWCHSQFNTALTRATHHLARRQIDQPHRSI